MPANSLINHYDKRALKGFAEELLVPNTFLVKTFFRDMEEFASEAVDLDLYKGKRRVGAYVKRRAEGQLVDKIGYSTKTFNPPYLKPKTPITPGDIQKRQAGQFLYDNSSNLSSAVEDFVARQINDLDNIITRNEELQAMQALFNGIVTALDVDGNTLATIDYGRDAALSYTVSTLWDAGTEDPLKDCRAARRLVQQKSGFTPRLVLMGSDAADAFLASSEVQGQLSKDWSARGNLAYDMREDGGIWLGHADGFDFWSYDEYIIDPADSTEKLLVPSKKVLIASPNARATRTYGSIEVADFEGNLTIEAAARYVDMYGEKDPASTIVQVHSAPLMVTNHPDAYATLTVLT